ncbi:hypothetical protein K470DRAFT_256717 [Piedraia hortae CBS 480.64]|uniref:HTH La-type RNA-binding domain-containing protein n=1 Tax=Piedraia hortae CBS 480.64 TaxID=1314780 RepID=A0A6A7C3Q7_9PEZI|nr:hypothetical protein K470DRAFT_256717 [Piedraia hortae CBS 480.64]
MSKVEASKSAEENKPAAESAVADATVTETVSASSASAVEEASAEKSTEANGAGRTVEESGADETAGENGKASVSVEKTIAEAESTEKQDTASDAKQTEPENEIAKTSEKTADASAGASKDTKDSKDSTRKSRPNQRKSTFTQPESSDPVQILHQVEFYFSDSNLPIDTFLLKSTGGHANKPIPLATIHNFKRMRHFQPYSSVRSALLESKLLNLDEQDNITRKIPLDEKFTDSVKENSKLLQAETLARSVYVKGFGEEGEDTHLEIEGFFKNFGPVRAVRLRRDFEGRFKGSVFVEFESEDVRDGFLGLETKPMWKGEELMIKSKKEYLESKGRMKDGEEEVKKNGGQEKKRSGAQRGGRGGRGGRGRGRGGSRGTKRSRVDGDESKGVKKVKGGDGEAQAVAG